MKIPDNKFISKILPVSLLNDAVRNVRFVNVDATTCNDSKRQRETIHFVISAVR